MNMVTFKITSTVPLMNIVEDGNVIEIRDIYLHQGV